MNTRLTFALLLIVITLSVFSNQNKEFFSPGKWVGEQITGLVVPVLDGLWGAFKGPAPFTRDIAYNIGPNYTMVDRYLKEKNDWVRANKGIPKMKPAKGVVRFNFNDSRDEKDNKYSGTMGLAGSDAIGSSLINKIF